MKKPRTHVKTFIPVMARQVEARTKRQTVRQWPKREQDIPKEGHRISCREWTGKPYASKQRVLCEGRITEVLRIKIRLGSILLCRLVYRKRGGGIRFEQVSFMVEYEMQKLFAMADGFSGLLEFHEWFLKKGAAAFTGILIKWEPDA